MEDGKESATASRPTVVLIATGAAVILATFLPELLGLAGRPGIGLGQQLLIAIGLTLVLLGLASRSPRIRRRLTSIGKPLATAYQIAAFAVFNTVILVAGLEVVGDWIDRQAPPEHDLAAHGPYYGSQPWAQLHWQEFDRLYPHFVYRPYLLWQTPPFRGETLNVDAEGRRHTPEPVPRADDQEERHLVLAFGGSAMWGHGAPDDATVPAFLQTELRQALGRPVRVENLGERGHVVTQSLIRLLLELQAGRTPDRVIFHHGFNEVAVALDGEPGDHYDVARVAGLLEQPLLAGVSRTRALRLLRPWISKPTDEPTLSDSEMERRAAAVVDNYLGSYRLISALARDYGFEFHCFWQPVRALGSAPESAHPSARARTLDRLLVAGYRELETRAGDYDRLVSLGSLLDPRDDHLWADPVHLTPLGNQRVAAAMLEAIVRATDTAPSATD